MRAIEFGGHRFGAGHRVYEVCRTEHRPSGGDMVALLRARERECERSQFVYALTAGFGSDQFDWNVRRWMEDVVRAWIKKKHTRTSVRMGMRVREFDMICTTQRFGGASAATVRAVCRIDFALLRESKSSAASAQPTLRRRWLRVFPFECVRACAFRNLHKISAQSGGA